MLIGGKKFKIRVTVERRRAGLNIFLGLLITALYAFAQHAGLLDGPERQAYDWRVRQFQMYNPGPTDRLVHLDMDDLALENIGAWPWPRDKFARIVDEVALANASVLMFDIIFGETNDTLLAGDEALAKSMKAFGRVVLPVTVTTTPLPPPPRLKAVIEKEFATDLSIDDQSIVKHLIETKQIEPGQKDDVLPVISNVRLELFVSRVSEALERDPATTEEQLRAQLLKGMDPTITLDTRLDNLHRTMIRVQKEQALLRFTIRKPASAPKLFTVTDCLPPLTNLQAAAAWSGIVDTITEADGRLRTKPLFLDYHGRMMPSASFMTALALLDVPLNTVQVSPTEVSFPLPKGGRTVIPVRSITTDANGTGGLVMDIGWWGTGDWKTMYDFPRYRQSRQHLNVTEIWTAVQLQDRLINNRRALDSAIRFILRNCDTSDGQSSYHAYLDATKEGTLTVDDIQGYVGLYGDFLTPKLESLRAEEKQRGKSAQLTEFITALTRYDAQAKFIVGQLGDVEKALKKSREYIRERLNGKAVILGWTATGKVDRYVTPVHSDAAPGVVAHGAVVSGVLSGYLWGHAAPIYSMLATIVMGVATTIALAYFEPISAFIAAVILGVGYTVFNGYYLFNYNHTVVSLVAPALAGGTVWAVVTLVRYISDLRQRRRIEKRVSSYLDPQLVEYLIQHPEEDTFGGVEKEISVAFTDLEGSTNMGESLGKGIVKILNEYMGAMTPAVRSRRGLIDKFLGDGIMFMFNALEASETHAADAVSTALEMQEIQAEFNKGLIARNLPALGTRIGINTGLMIMGDAGSRDAANFTVLGDNVNLASRMEGANKPFGSRINISDRTYELCRDQFYFRPLGRIRVKGKEQAVMCWEPLCAKAKITPEIEQKIALSSAIFNAFVEARFEDCMRACDTMDKALGASKYTAIYHKSAVHCLAEGAGDAFDGVITLADK